MSEGDTEFTRYREPESAGAPEPEPAEDPGVLEVLPGLARIAAVAWWRGTRWSVETSVRVGNRLVRYAASGRAPGEVFSEGGTDLRVWLRRFLEMVDESGTAAANPGGEPGGGSAQAKA
ncbi:MAG: hypothetical protein M3340_12400, partial [Actinomycetota bacterium]|nr:hypothetical protein [Actinomycetota bacterium]